MATLDDGRPFIRKRASEPHHQRRTWDEHDIDAAQLEVAVWGGQAGEWTGRGSLSEDLWSRAGLVRRPRTVGLDTGCVWGGRLSAWVPEEDRLVSVPAARQYAEF